MKQFVRKLKSFYILMISMTIISCSSKLIIVRPKYNKMSITNKVSKTVAIVIPNNIRNNEFHRYIGIYSRKFTLGKEILIASKFYFNHIYDKIVIYENKKNIKETIVFYPQIIKFEIFQRPDGPFNRRIFAKIKMKIKYINKIIGKEGKIISSSDYISMLLAPFGSLDDKRRGIVVGAALNQVFEKSIIKIITNNSLK